MNTVSRGQYFLLYERRLWKQGNDRAAKRILKNVISDFRLSKKREIGTV
jgi:hypothetical protein